MFRKYVGIILILLTIFLAACSTVTPPAQEQPGETATQEPTPLPPTDEPPAPGDGSETTDPTGEAPVADLPLLPPLPANPGGLGVGGGGAGAPTTAESADITLDSRMIVEPFDIFSGTTFLLNTTLPADPLTAPVWRNPEIYPDLNQAYALAQKLGFTGPLYQDALPPEVRDQIETLGEGVYRMPFYAFRGNEWLTITSGSAFYENRGLTQDREPVSLPLDRLQPLVEAQIAAWGGLDFEYVIVDEGFNNVAVRRLLNGRPLDFTELYFHFNNQAELVYASVSTLNGLTPIGDYPLIPAAAAWDKILAGVLENNIWFSYIYDPTMQVLPEPMPIGIGDSQFWERKYQPGDTTRIYGYPQIFLPVQDDSEPVVQVNQYLLNAPVDELRRLAAERPNQIVLEGVIGANGRSIDLIGWEPMGDNETPLFLEGVIARTDAGVVIQTTDGQTYLLPDAPAEVADGLEVFVFAWRALEDSGAPYPVLDWVNIDKKIDFDVENLPAEAMPEAPIDDIRLAVPPVITQIAFDEVHLGYLYVAQWPRFEDGTEYVPPAYDMPPVLLQPFWQFIGTTDSGERMQFNVPAVDPAYFGQ